jgi:hypothetical protein
MLIKERREFLYQREKNRALHKKNEPCLINHPPKKTAVTITVVLGAPITTHNVTHEYKKMTMNR